MAPGSLTAVEEIIMHVLPVLRLDDTVTFIIQDCFCAKCRKRAIHSKY